jgi:acyl carrier protein
MNTRNEVIQALYFAVSETLSVPTESLAETTRITEDLEADSMDIVTLAISLDDRFGLEMDLSELPSSDVTLGWIADYIEQKLR